MEEGAAGASGLHVCRLVVGGWKRRGWSGCDGLRKLRGCEIDAVRVVVNGASSAYLSARGAAFCSAILFCCIAVDIIMTHAMRRGCGRKIYGKKFRSTALARGCWRGAACFVA